MNRVQIEDLDHIRRRLAFPGRTSVSGAVAEGLHLNMHCLPTYQAAPRMGIVRGCV